MITPSSLAYQLFNSIRKNQFCKFLLVGALNTLFGYSLFVLFIYLGLHYVMATFISTCLGVCFNFKTTGILVFRQNNNTFFWRFVFAYVLMYFMSISMIKMGTYFITDIYLNGGIVTLIMALIAYLLNSRFVFQRIKNEVN